MSYIDNHLKKPTGEYIIVDGSYIWSNGETRYQGMIMPSQKKIIESNVYKGGSSNIAEFLAIAEALYWCKKNSSSLPIYSDSMVAIKWILNNSCKTNVERNDKTKMILDDTIYFLDWLFNNPIENKIIQWKTKLWGENPADFGFK